LIGGAERAFFLLIIVIVPIWGVSFFMGSFKPRYGPAKENQKVLIN
jgi:hypothetical protein